MGRIVVIMGVSCCGKSTVGNLVCQTALAQGMSASFVEGDDFHSEASKAKIKSGVGLDDADRQPWLEYLADIIGRAERDGPQLTVVACSALKRKYRALLVSKCADSRRSVVVVQLALEEVVAAARSASRRNHFATSSIVKSQYDTLEELSLEEGQSFVPVTIAVDSVSAQVVAQNILGMLQF